MEKLGLNELRKLFLDFYKEKEHLQRKSFSLVPENDKSLLIVNSGMAPLKTFFAGTEVPPAPRMTTCQKCIRTGDIDNVGLTARHCTFFEMLGSFSFGDYFKKESLIWGWEFIIDVLKMPEDKLWASIYEEDEEAYEIWINEINFPKEKIVRLGKEDNYWEIGVGPCGPCSEVYFDRGAHLGCDNPDCKPGCDCDRYVEFWNHVFTQFNRQEDGTYLPLAKKNIDTGMGLERLACIMQEVESVFNVDTIRYILNEITRVAGISYYDGKEKSDVSVRIITDHIRAVTFLIGDGVIPSNEGRGYVLRRLLRRAARHGRIIGIKGDFLAELSKKVIEISSNAYPELEEKREYIYKILTIEEEKFAETLDQGMQILDDYIKQLNNVSLSVLNGEKAFRLYDTFGFPVEMTIEVLEEHGFTVDMDSFNKEMQKQKELARAGRKSETDVGWAEDAALYALQTQSEFIGYDALESRSTVKALFWEKSMLDCVKEGETARLLLDKTPFYPESGGQAADIGIIYNDNFQAEVIDVQKKADLIFHQIKVIQGEIKVEEDVVCLVDSVSRNNTARNHTATHLLHKALKEVIGQHVDQAGSLVTDKNLRFDFKHFEAITKDELADIEMIVNDKISEFLNVNTEELDIATAKERGATALFGEKYGNRVRMVTVDNFSIELCGGTHVNNSGQIGAFKILSENGVAAGVRRIEAITGMELYKHLNTVIEIAENVAVALKTSISGLTAKAHSFADDARATKKELEEFKKRYMSDGVEDIIENAKEIKGIKLIAKRFKDYSIDDMRSLADNIREKNNSVVIVFASEVGDKVVLMTAVSNDLLDKGYHAGNIIKQVAAVCGGGGGGKADMAQAGGKDVSKIDDALKVAEGLI